MRQYFDEHWEEMLAALTDTLRYGVICALIILVLVQGAELLDNARGTFAIVRDLRGEFRSAVGSKESTEE